MKTTKTQEIKQLPPYVPFKAFKGFVERLHGTAIPPAIDPSLLRNMSGSARSQLMSCLKFLKLTGSDGAVTDTFRTLIKSYKTDKWADVLSETIFASYHEVIGDVDLDNGTDAQLDNAFRQRGGVDGQVLDKAKRFYLAALTESGTKYSPHFGMRKPYAKRATPSRKVAKKGADMPVWEDETDEGPDEPSGKMPPFRIPIRDKGQAILVFPGGTDAEDWVTVRRMLDAYFGTDQ